MQQTQYRAFSFLALNRAAWIAVLALMLLLMPIMAMASTTLKIHLETDPSSEHYASVLFTGIPAQQLAAWRIQGPSQQALRERFSVRVLLDSSKEIDEQEGQAVAGRYQLVDAGLRFEPAFLPSLPLSSGLRYQVRAQLTGYEPVVKQVQFHASSQTEVATPVKVEAVYPSAAHIPENNLRFYVQFSKPMSRGQVFEHIDLLDEHGEVLDAAFIVGPLGELWDAEQRRLTLLLDPGRIKQGVAPNRALGVALQAGRQRTLRISKEFKDAKGQALGSEFRRSYQISPATRSAVAVANWQVIPPSAGTLVPLILNFPRSLDHALLQHALSVYDSQGLPVRGEVQISHHEKTWCFSPKQPWSAGPYQIRVAAELEDLAGNNLRAPMDVDLASGIVVSAIKRAELSFTPQ